MRRFLGISLAIVVLGSIASCGGGGSGVNASSTIATLAAGVASEKAFSGEYAFLLTGYDPAGVPMAIAGCITANGNGQITNGAIDVNDNQVLNSSSAVTGTYTADVNSRGIITIANQVGTIPFPLAFAFTMRKDGTQATIIGFDNNDFVVSGTMQLQTPAAFSLPALAGNFVYETDSHIPTQRSSIGRFTLGASGAIGNGVDDASVAVSGPLLTDNTSFSAAYLAPATNGRGTASVTESGTTRNFAYYIINASKFVAIELDGTGSGSTTLATTVATSQTIPPSATTAGAVFALTGLDTSLSQTISSVGQLVMTGSAANFTWDSNDAGTTIFPNQTSNGIATVGYDPTTGRGTITMLNQAVSGLFDSAVFYLSGPGAGYILDTTAAGAATPNRAFAGALTQQTGVGSFTTGSISANTIGVTPSGDSPSGGEAVDLLFAITPTNNTISGLQDITQAGAENPSEQFSGLVFGGVGATTGRGTITATTAAGPATYAVYLIAPNQFVFIGTTAGAFSPVFLFIPQ